MRTFTLTEEQIGLIVHVLTERRTTVVRLMIQNAGQPVNDILNPERLALTEIIRILK